VSKGFLMKVRFAGIVGLICLPWTVHGTPTDPYREVNEGWERFGAVYARIIDSYYANLDNKEIMQAAIEGMLDKLDAYSQFYDEEGLRQLRQDTTGKFAGLGITVAIKDHYPIVISPIEDTPASRAGLRTGDLIVAIEDQDTRDLSLDEIVDALRGDPGTQVRVTIAPKPGGARRVISIEREIIAIKSVSLVEELTGNIGYISMRQTRFSESTSEEVEGAIKELLTRDVKGIVLDLRGNPGGLLTQATQVADLFLPKGAPIVSIREREGRREETKHSQRRPVLGDLPLVVLIDEGSASASEIVAGAIQDNDRGVLIGTTSFGKGSVQTIFDLQEAAESALKLTTALYYTPSGRSIHREYSGGADQANRIKIADRELPAALVMDVILEAVDEETALAALQARFDIDEKTAHTLLRSRFVDLIGMESPINTQEADSLSGAKNQYFTQQGRKVFGGGGINPDIQAPTRSSSHYVQNLERRRLFFDFIVDYTASDSILQERLEPDDEMVNSFREFVQQANKEDHYDFGSDQFKSLREIIDELGWLEVSLSLDKLEGSFEKERNKGFTDALEGEIRWGLEKELVLRYRGKKAQQRLELRGDPQLEKALEVLSNAKEYMEALVKKD
jgi:carboxyl-terminal processing protease